MMSNFQERLAKERRHLLDGPVLDKAPSGMGTVRFVVGCHGNVEQVIERAKAVLMAVNENSVGQWPNDDEWRVLLPSWFVAYCGPELTQAEAEAEVARWRMLSWEDKIQWEREHRWSLSNWIFCFRSENRHWYWWDATLLNEAVIAVAVEAYEWPFPSEALSWLLRAAGADKFEAEE